MSTIGAILLVGSLTALLLVSLLGGGSDRGMAFRLRIENSHLIGMIARLPEWALVANLLIALALQAMNRYVLAAVGTLEMLLVIAALSRKQRNKRQKPD